MIEDWTSQKPVLVYDRIEANRRNTLLLLGLFVMLCLPLALYVGRYLMFLLAVYLMMPVLQVSKQGAYDPAFVLTLSGIWALFISFLITYLMYLYSSRLILRISNAKPLKEGEERQLRRIVENLCIGSGLPQPKLAIIDSMATNAFSTGLDPERASLVVTRGLLDALDRQELEGVIAQELSQIGNHDIRLNTVVAALVTTMLLPLLTIQSFWGTYTPQHPIERLAGGFLLLVAGPPLILGPLQLIGAVALSAIDPVIGIFLGTIILLALSAPFGCLFIHRAASREREFRADADAALLTRYPAGLARALIKVGEGNNAKMHVSPTTANLYIVNPLSRDNGYLNRLLSSHPPIEERIKQLVRMGGVTPTMIEKAHKEGAKFYLEVLTGRRTVPAH